ncbi:MAG TPA: DinB family protein [Pyrinomonadaceae bacterium]|nr:DinB family protein [Pyrinomonadaceae bacterium]
MIWGSGILEGENSLALIDGMLQELEQEAQTTRRVLERVPDDRLSWRPHEKARTLGELALHVATVPGNVAEFVAAESPVQAPQFTDPSPQKAAELVPALEESIAKAKKLLGGMDDAALQATWRVMQGERELLAIPRVAGLRSIMLNHWYHHRGQLSVYLRELDVPIPSIYGPSADENPFT